MGSPTSCASGDVSCARNYSALSLCAVALVLLACIGLTSCGGSTSNPDPTTTIPETGSAPTIASFTANSASIKSGSSSTLSWTTTGATSIAITPGTFTSTSANGSTSVSPTSTTTYTLAATNAAGATKSTATVTVTAADAGGPLTITTTSSPGGTQTAAYAGCTISASGGSLPYTFSVSTSSSYPPLPEGLSLSATTGRISSARIGGQGTYSPLLVVTDSTSTQATQQISFAINGDNSFLASIFPATSIFHHRVDAASTGLPVDTSPAAPIYSGYLSATIKPFFGNTDDAFPNGIPALEVPYNQADVAIATTQYQSYFSSGPIPANAPVEGTSNSTGDRHVLIYREAGGGNNPALYEMWQGIYEGGPWTDSSNALWPNVSSNVAALLRMRQSSNSLMTASPRAGEICSEANFGMQRCSFSERECMRHRCASAPTPPGGAPNIVPICPLGGPKVR